jgi:hypothetical protein
MHNIRHYFSTLAVVMLGALLFPVAAAEARGTSDIVWQHSSGQVHYWPMLSGQRTGGINIFTPVGSDWTLRGVGDVDGDGTADIVWQHSSGQVHYWPMRDGQRMGGINIFTPVGSDWTLRGVGDVNGDGTADIVWQHSSGQVHYWPMQGGQRTGGINIFTPVGSDWTLRGVGDVNGDGTADIVWQHSSGQVHYWPMQGGQRTGGINIFTPVGSDWTLRGVGDVDFVPLAPGQVGVTGLEVTQTVQDLAHTVALVANKRTVVRAYLDINAPSAATVTGNLLVWRPPLGPWQVVPASGNATVDPARNGQIRAQRETLTASLNFELPAALLADGPVMVTLFNVRRAGSGVPVACANCNISIRVVTMQSAPPARVRVLGITYPFGTPPVVQTPRTLDFDRIASWIGRAYPTAQVQMARLNVPATATWPFNCNQVNAQLSAIRNLDVSVNNTVDARTHYYGLVWDGGGFMRGCASGIPGSADPTTVASGPTGVPSGTFGWDTDGSYGDWYTGHELGHTYGRFHIGSGCGETSDDPGYPFPSGQISSADGAFVGFDVGDTAAGIARAALPGTQWRDVMSYCQNQWVSSYTYRRIWDRLAAEDVLAPGAPAPTGENVPVAAGPRPSVEAAGAPSPGVTRGEMRPQQAVGYRDRQQQSEPSSAAVPGPGLSPAMPAIPVASERAAAAADQSGDMITPEMRAAFERHQQAEGMQQADDMRARAGAAREAPNAQLREGDFVNVVATVNLTRNTGDVAYVNRVNRALIPTASRPLVPTSSSGAELGEVRAVDASGRVVASQLTPIKFDSDKEPGEDRTGIVDAFLPTPESATAIEVLISGRVIARRDVGATLPASRVDPGAAAAPIRPMQVSPTARAAGGGILLDWSAAGASAAGVTYSVLVSTDGGASWQTLAVGVREPRLQVSTDQFGVAKLQVRVLASNGLQTSEIARQDVDVISR